ncbi:hypothetical protein XELAEV_18027454mg [Xenopus laevis]|uniref:Uncharacterized protein n=1 Tax=Xenopus laevis TaxID=8355 RepID=A0A974HKB0_XENLA|nr:hypothetical protein XELAEV_18027454mg [Xenopus laevis]
MPDVTDPNEIVLDKSCSVLIEIVADDALFQQVFGASADMPVKGHPAQTELYFVASLGVVQISLNPSLFTQNSSPFSTTPPERHVKSLTQ